MSAPAGTERRFVVEAWRGTRVESRHEVWCSTVAAHPPAASLAGSTTPSISYLRSAAKPFQLLPLVVAGGAERFQCDRSDLALMASSHDGTESHAARVASLLARMGLDESALRCGVHRPYYLDALPPDAPESRRVFGPLHNNCSGNHAAMLGVALVCGVGVDRYLDPTTPGQARVHALIAALSGVEPVLAVDNCAAPCYGMPLAAMAEAYRFLARPAAVRALPASRRERLEFCGEIAPVEDGLDRIAAALAEEPAWASGERTSATRLARALDGNLVVKHGAEGVLCLAHRGTGEAIALKVADGNARALLPVVMALARESAWLSPAALRELQDLAEPEIRGRLGQVVGCLRVADS